MAKYTNVLRNRLKKEEGYIFFKKNYKYRIALVYPNTYKVGMANLGFQLVYLMLNSYEDIFCERFFLPDKDEWDILSVETQTPLHKFDLVLFSIQTEFDYINVIDILKRSGIGILKEKRRKPVMAGGIAVSYNPYVLSPFLDGFFLGEAETGVLDHLHSALKFLEDKNTFLSFLSTNPHIYIPEIEKNTRKKVGRINKLESPTNTHIFSEDTVFGDMFLLEVARGCEARCRFCIAGYFVKPFRPKPVELVKQAVEWGKSFRKRLGLIGADVSNYPWLEEIKDLAEYYELDVSFSSLRPILHNKVLFDILKTSSQKTATIAPETGTDRLRFLINKVHRNEEYLDFAERIVKDCGVRNIKLYFLIGLPFEEKEDLEEIIRLSEKIASIKGLTSVLLSVNHLVPKPFTPFYNYSFDFLQIKERAELFTQIANRRNYKGKIKIELEKPENTMLEYILSTGNEKTGINLYESYINYGKNPKRFLRYIDYKVEINKHIGIDSGIKEAYIRSHWNCTLKQKPPLGDCKDGCQVCNLCDSPYVSSKTLRLNSSMCNKTY